MALGRPEKLIATVKIRGRVENDDRFRPEVKVEARKTLDFAVARAVQIINVARKHNERIAATNIVRFRFAFAVKARIGESGDVEV